MSQAHEPQSANCQSYDHRWTAFIAEKHVACPKVAVSSCGMGKGSYAGKGDSPMAPSVVGECPSGIPRDGAECEYPDPRDLQRFASALAHDALLGFVAF